MSGWPHRVFDWDILFLLPLPWWGPVIAPVSIATIFILSGTVITQTDSSPRRVTWLVAVFGALIALYTFMEDALRVAHLGERAIRAVLPTSFDWTLFVLGLALMAVPAVDMAAGVMKVWKPSQGSLEAL